MKFIITGSNGYIATQVAKYLHKDHTLISVIREGSTNKNPDLYADTLFYDGSIDSLKSEFAKHKDAFAVVHLAALYTTKSDLESAKELMESNVFFTAQLLSLSSQFGYRFIGASTFSMFNENHEYAPRSLYDVTKFAMESLAETYPVSSAILYLSDTYGPDDSRNKVHNLINRGALEALNSKSSQRINLTHTEDIARAIEAVAHYLENDLSVGPHKFEVFYKEQEIDLAELVGLLGKEVDFLGKQDNYGIPPLKYPIPGYNPKHKVANIKSVLEG